MISHISPHCRVDVISCEKTFCTLKFMQNYLRTTMGHSRPQSLAILVLEQEITYNTNFESITHYLLYYEIRKSEHVFTYMHVYFFLFKKNQNMYLNINLKYSILFCKLGIVL